MKKILIIAIIMMVGVLKGSAQDQILGIWLTENGENKVEIYKKDGMYFGKIVWVSSKDSEKHIGTDILKSLVYTESKYKGQLYAPKRDITMETVAKLKDDDKLQLDLYYKRFSKTATWTRSSL